MENIEHIIHKSRILTDQLRLAVLLQNNLTQDCFDMNGVQFSKGLEVYEKGFLSSEKKFQTIQEEVDEAKKKVAELSEELTALEENNYSLTKTENTLLNQIEESKSKRSEVAKYLQSQMNAYKTITGIRFSTNNSLSTETLSGYVAISGDEPSQCTIVPFDIDKQNCNKSQLLWDIIQKACLDVSPCN